MSLLTPIKPAKKPRIGLYSVWLRAYWDQFPGLRERLLAEGHEPYPVSVPRTHSLAEIRAAYPDLPADAATGDAVGVTGRVVFARNSGKLCFATLQEGDGTQLQVMLIIMLQQLMLYYARKSNLLI